MKKSLFQDLTNRPLEHTPNPQPTVYEGIPFIWGFGDVWGMLQGYVGFPLDLSQELIGLKVCLDALLRDFVPRRLYGIIEVIGLTDDG